MGKWQKQLDEVKARVLSVSNKAYGSTDPFRRIRQRLRKVARLEGMNTLAKIRAMRQADPLFAEWGKETQDILIRSVLSE